MAQASEDFQGSTPSVTTTTVHSTVQPYIPADVSLPEMTFKGVVLGIILAIVLAGSNAYLGLKMGQTISASIPAAVISMTVLRLFRRSNILENNIVQTIASAGEVAAAGIIFTIPALIVMGYWLNFHYWQVTFIAILGGVLGVIFSIPLRRALIVESELRFPEGIATAEVLKAGETAHQNALKARENGTQAAANTGARFLIIGAFGASFIKFCQSGLHLLGETVQGWFKVGGAVFGCSTGLSLSMIAAGYIVGMRVCINFVIGIIIAWVIGVPYYSLFSTPQDFGLPADADPMSFAMAIRADKIRYIGIGAMIIGGIWVLISLVNPIKNAIKSSLSAFAKGAISGNDIPRTERDIPMTYVLGGIILMAIPLLYMFHHVLNAANLGLSTGLYWMTIGILTTAAIVIGFICSSIGGYMAGIVGSSANPISGITIGSILIISTLIVVLLGSQVVFGVKSEHTLSLAAVTIMIAGVVAVAAAFGCDNLQDLKAGQLVGSTPWKQQLTLLIGAVAGALVVSQIMELLFQAYGIGGVFPREGMDPQHALSAPQATLMASVTQGILEQTLDWSVVRIGMLIGIIVVLVDKFILEATKSEWRLSVLAIALGVYLPLDITAALVVGGIISAIAQSSVKNQNKGKSEEEATTLVTKTERQGLLLSAGIIAGDALVGILLAVPFAAYQSTNVLAIVGPSFEQTGIILGTLMFLGVCYYMHQVGSKVKS